MQIIQCSKHQNALHDKASPFLNVKRLWVDIP